MAEKLRVPPGHEVNVRMLRRKRVQKTIHICSFPACTQSFRRLKHLEEHFFNEHDSKLLYYCTVSECPRSRIGSGFIDPRSLTAHAKVHEVELAIPSPVFGCTRESVNPSSLQLHLSADNDEAVSPYFQDGGCIRTKEVFWTVDERDEHIHDTRDKTKTEAMIQSKLESDIKARTNIETKTNTKTKDNTIVKKVPCTFPGCDKVFGGLDTMSYHHAQDHNEPTRHYCGMPTCTVLDIWFPRVDQIRQHQSIHW